MSKHIFVDKNKKNMLHSAVPTDLISGNKGSERSSCSAKQFSTENVTVLTLQILVFNLVYFLFLIEMSKKQLLSPPTGVDNLNSCYCSGCIS